jgi:hypothetical protein
MFRRQQHAHCRLDRVGIGGGTLHRNGSVIELAPIFGLPNFRRNLDEHRPAFAAAHRLIGAAHQVGEFLHRMGQRRPFGDRPVHLGGAEHRPHILPRQRQAGRNHEQRDVLGKSPGNAGEGVLDTRARLRGEYAVAFAALDAGVTVRQADADALLPAEDWAYVEGGAGLDQRVARIAGEKLRAFAPENFGDHGGAVHGWFLPWLARHSAIPRHHAAVARHPPPAPEFSQFLEPVGAGPHARGKTSCGEPIHRPCVVRGASVMLTRAE